MYGSAIPPSYYLNNQPWHNYHCRTQYLLVHGDINEMNMPRRIHGNAAPRSATCFLWHVASGTPELRLKSRVTWMYRRALCRILRLEDFFSSWETGNCRFKSSKHSFRCARRFFSSLLWTSRVPALKQGSIITLSHQLHRHNVTQTATHTRFWYSL